MVFEDFLVPEPVILGPFLVSAVLVAVVLYALGPPVRSETVLAFIPWMVLGSLLHVLYQMHLALGGEILPGRVDVLFSAPSVYLTTFVIGGAIWAVTVLSNPSETQTRAVARTLAAVGGGVLVLVGMYATWQAVEHFDIGLVLPLVGLVVSLALTAGLYVGIGYWRPYVVARAQFVGALVLFAHVFDGITTAIGIELLDAGERSTAPQFLLDVAAELPTADLLGEAWLFVLVKIIIASAIVVLFYDYTEERPTEGYLFFAAIAAVGLGPGAHNFFLFLFGVG